MARCGCAGDSCSCLVVAGRGARVTGKGTVNDPYIIDAYPMSLTVVDSGSVDLTLTGSGLAGDPWVISAVVGGSELDAKWTAWSGTQAEYDAIVTPDDGTLYGVTG